MNISTALSKATETLREAGIAEFRKESVSLLAVVLRKNFVFFIAHPEFELSDDEWRKYMEFVERRSRREPFQYVIGYQEFFQLIFDVSPDVLIPRPETEILVETAINILSGFDKPRFLEIGAGSGCISVSILHTVGSASAVGVDISEKALAVARRNAEKHNVAERLDLRHGDIFSGVAGTFDMIVSNPPYVPRDQIDSLQAEVRDFEPQVALDGGSDGLSIVETIIRKSPDHLKPKGFLLLEIGFDQAERVNELFDLQLWNKPEFIADLQGIPRIVKAVKTQNS